MKPLSRKALQENRLRIEARTKTASAGINRRAKRATAKKSATKTRGPTDNGVKRSEPKRSAPKRSVQRANALIRKSLPRYQSSGIAKIRNGNARPAKHALHPI